MSPSSASRASRFSLALALGVLVIFALHLRSWIFTCDDAYISFRYALNLAEHGAPVYNLEPLERVEGYTNPAWVLLLALFAKLGLQPPSSAALLCGLSAGLSLLLCAGLVRETLTRANVEFREAELFVAPLGLALLPEFVVWGSGGLEGAANLAAGLTASLLALRDRWRAAGVAAALCLLFRGDSVIWLAPMLGVLAVQRIRSENEGEGAAWRGPAETVLIVAAIVGAHLLWRHTYYGEWLPNTWKVKQHGVALRESWGVDYLHAWAFDGGFIYLAPLLLLARAWSLVWLVGLVGNLTWAWWVGGDFMAYGRFLLPATTFALLFFGSSLIALRQLIESRGGPGRAPVALALVLALVALWRLPGRLDRDHDEAWIDEKWESVQAMHEFARVRVAAGEAFAREWPANTRATVGAAGAMPYASRFFIFDAYGLVDPGVAEQQGAVIQKGARPGHVVYAPESYLRSRKPDLLCHRGYVGETKPGMNWARKYGGRGFGWACVETGPIEDARAPAGVWPSRYYCCLQPPEVLGE